MSDIGTAPKPPLGVCPRLMWLHNRAVDLSNAIHAYVIGGFIGEGYNDDVCAWARELDDILIEIQSERESGDKDQ